MKYFQEIPNGKWLGDIISIIKLATPSDRIHRLQRLLPAIIELNDYSKHFHHASTTTFMSDVNPQELKTYSLLLLDLVDEI